MTKMVGAAEFKAKCLRLIEEMQTSGEPITVTRRGKPVATVSPAIISKREPGSIFGCMRGTISWASDDDLIRPVWDNPWDAELGKWEPEP